MEKDYTLVFATSNNIQAEIAKDILEEYEIKCIVLNQHDSMIPSIGQVEIYVQEDDKENAIEILKKLKN